MPARACLLCGRLTRQGSYCAAHSRPWSRRSPSSIATDQRGWAKVRAEVLRRDWNACVRCGDPDNLQVHHIVPVSEGGANVIANLETLCASCHRAAHRQKVGATVPNRHSV